MVVMDIVITCFHAVFNSLVPNNHNSEATAMLVEHGILIEYLLQRDILIHMVILISTHIATSFYPMSDFGLILLTLNEENYIYIYIFLSNSK